jgi:hypothetical protein
MNNPSPFEWSGPLRTALALVVALAGIALMPANALAQANPNPPSRLTYQGFLVGSDGVALGNTAPKNYDVIFTIFNSEVGSAPANTLWAEQQTVTVDKGYFNVLLGEGAAVPGVAHSDLSALFKGTDASDRFVGTTVKGIGANGANVDITPRLRLLSSPYSLLSRSALKLVADTGADLISGTGTNVTVAGDLTLTGTFTAGGVIPIGGIILWSGTIAAIPSGWALCNGQTVNGRTTPDLRDRFVIGAGNFYAVGNTGGATNVTLTVPQLPPHFHTYQDVYFIDPSGFGGFFPNFGINNIGGTGRSRYTDSFTSTVGSGQPVGILNPYFALGYIMRVQ